MKAIVQSRYGSPEVLEFKEIDRPVVGDRDVLIRVHAAAVNPADLLMMTGEPYIARPAFGMRRPRRKVMGSDVSGTVVAVGRKVSLHNAGDEVFGWCVGSFAEYASAPADHFVAKPAGVSFEQAAATPMAGLCALQILRDRARVRSGQKILVNGAGGGIGHFAVQIAKAHGAEVTGVCSTKSVEMVRSLGADEVIDYTKADFTRSGRRYDFIFDNAGNHPLSRVRQALTRDGILVSNNGTTGGPWFGTTGRLFHGLMLSMFGKQKFPAYLSTGNQADLQTLAELMSTGRVTPMIDRTYPLSDAASAVSYLAQGHARGKVVISVL